VTLGVDVGGTFTDLVRWDGESLTTGKLSSTPDQSEAVGVGVGDLIGRAADPLLLHGTTVATNALLERKGARVALITDSGFEHLIEIARQDRPSLYDPFADRAEPLVARELRLGWPQIATHLSGRLEALGAEAVAIALLGSYRDGTVEDEIAAGLKGVGPSLSHRVSGEFREYERIATTVLNAYLQPVVDRYLSDLARKLTGLVERVLVLRSSGGLTSVAGASQLAASILLSGPAGGVVAAAGCGSAHGWNRVISFDMGGTSTDVCRIENGRPEVFPERTIEGYICRMPSVAVHTIGAGGGSIAWADQGAALRVGPQSAGANPGPAAYARGGFEPTVTDANLIMGRLGTEAPLASGLGLDDDLARSAIAVLAATLSMSAPSLAAGILQVVDTLMERAVRRVSVEQGADPRQAALVAFGGAGGLHATSLARRLDMPAVLIPPHAGVFSALGLLLSPQRHDLARTVLLNEDSPELEVRVAELVSLARSEFNDEVGLEPEAVEVTADVRYPGQSHETGVRYKPGAGWREVADRFHEAHATINGFARPDQPVELVTLRVTALAPPSLTWSDLPMPVVGGAARIGDRVVADGSVVSRWRRPGLAPGDEVIGPAVVEETEATTWLSGGEMARVLDDGTLMVTW
jgi:N-methylhydantoinase A